MGGVYYAGMTRLICLILFFVVSVIAGAQTYVVSNDILADGSTEKGNSLSRLSNVFLGFLAVADVKGENALIEDEDFAEEGRDNNQATRRDRNRRRRKDNRLRRTNNRRSNRSSDSNEDQNDNTSQTVRRRKGRRVREQDDNEQIE